EECPKNIRLGVAKNLKRPSQTSQGVPVGPKMGFKPHKEYNPVPKKPTTSPSGNKKKGVAHTNEVSNSNPFDVLNSVDNDVELERVGLGTQSLMEQWVDSYGNGDYDEDLYDDDMYEGQDLLQEIQAICDNLDIRVRGHKKKYIYVSFV
ncbi:hypothetical protein Tco_1131462, partial [Tanacetum coccineum]